MPGLNSTSPKRFIIPLIIEQEWGTYVFSSYGVLSKAISNAPGRNEKSIEITALVSYSLGFAVYGTSKYMEFTDIKPASSPAQAWPGDQMVVASRAMLQNHLDVQV